MKKLLALSFCLAIASCGGGAKESSGGTTTASDSNNNTQGDSTKK